MYVVKIIIAFIAPMINIFIVRSLLNKEAMNITQLILTGIMGMCVVSFYLCFKDEITHCLETFIGWATGGYKIEIKDLVDFLVGWSTGWASWIYRISIPQFRFSIFQPAYALPEISSSNSSVKSYKLLSKYQFFSSTPSAGNTGASSNSAGNRTNSSSSVIRAGNTGAPNRANFGRRITDLINTEQSSTQQMGATRRVYPVSNTTFSTIQIAAPSSSAQSIIQRASNNASASSSTNISALAEASSSSQTTTQTAGFTLKIFNVGQTGSFFDGNNLLEIESNRAKYIKWVNQQSGLLGPINGEKFKREAMANVIFDIINQFKSHSTAKLISIHLIGISYGSVTWLALQECFDDYVDNDSTVHQSTTKAARSLSLKLAVRANRFDINENVLREVARSLLSRS